MNRKQIVLIVFVLVLVSVVGLYSGRLLKIYKSRSLTAVVITPTPAPIELISWEDPSEFSIKYPKNLKLDPHDEDNENYAHVELTNPAQPGSIILWTKDTTYKTVDDYIKGNKIEKFIGSTMGDLPAVKVLDATDNNKYSLVTIRNGYLYQIEVDSKGEKKWNEIFGGVVDSYKFSEDSEMVKPAVNNNSQPQTSSEEIYSEEETIE